MKEKTVFIAGSMKIKHLDAQVKQRLDKIVDQDFEVIVGDAEGADSSIQTYLMEKGATKTTVYCTGERPRNNIGRWPVRTIQAKHPAGTRAYFTVKDVAMAEAANFGLMIWDAKSTGTLSNVIELLKRKKKSVVFVNKDKAFFEIRNVHDLENLVGRMSEHAKARANEKIFLIKLIELLKVQQSSQSTTDAGGNERVSSKTHQQLGLI